MSIDSLGVDFTRRKVRLTFQIAAPTSFDPAVPLEASGIINPNTFTLMETIDAIDEMGLETLRQTWTQSLQTERDDLAKRAIRKDRTKTDPVIAALDTISRHLDKQALAQWVRRAKFPIPDHYTVPLPDEGGNMRRDIIFSLVPFMNTRETLLRLEESLKLPVRIVTISNSPVSKNEVAMLEAEAALSNEINKMALKLTPKPPGQHYN